MYLTVFSHPWSYLFWSGQVMSHLPFLSDGPAVCWGEPQELLSEVEKALFSVWGGDILALTYMGISFYYFGVYVISWCTIDFVVFYLKNNFGPSGLSGDAHHRNFFTGSHLTYLLQFNDVFFPLVCLQLHKWRYLRCSQFLLGYALDAGMRSLQWNKYLCFMCNFVFCVVIETLTKTTKQN